MGEKTIKICENAKIFGKNANKTIKIQQIKYNLLILLVLLKTVFFSFIKVEQSKMLIIIDKLKSESFITKFGIRLVNNTSAKLKQIIQNLL